jgi:uncharacterized protein YqfA (UPF0365 family)
VLHRGLKQIFERETLQDIAIVIFAILACFYTWRFIRIVRFWLSIRQAGLSDSFYEWFVMAWEGSPLRKIRDAVLASQKVGLLATTADWKDYFVEGGQAEPLIQNFLLARKKGVSLSWAEVTALTPPISEDDSSYSLYEDDENEDKPRVKPNPSTSH